MEVFHSGDKSLPWSPAAYLVMEQQTAGKGVWTGVGSSSVCSDSVCLETSCTSLPIAQTCFSIKV